MANFLQDKLHLNKDSMENNKKALDTLKNLGIVKERANSSTERDETLYSIK